MSSFGRSLGRVWDLQAYPFPPAPRFFFPCCLSSLNLIYIPFIKMFSSYDLHWDRAFCLNCKELERQNSPPRGANPHVLMHGSLRPQSTPYQSAWDIEGISYIIINYVYSDEKICPFVSHYFLRIGVCVCILDDMSDMKVCACVQFSLCLLCIWCMCSSSPEQSVYNPCIEIIYISIYTYGERERNPAFWCSISIC